MSVANALQQLSISLACLFGVLTPNDEQQALDRAGGKYETRYRSCHALRMAGLKNH